MYKTFTCIHNYNLDLLLNIDDVVHHHPIHLPGSKIKTTKTKKSKDILRQPPPCMTIGQVFQIQVNNRPIASFGFFFINVVTGP